MRSGQERTIFHVDVNSAFLSWSAVKRLREDPEAVDLRTIPSAVGGDEATRHGIITAKSTPAKKYGIKTAMTVTNALRLCPNLVLVPADFKTYREFSHQFIAILKKYTDLVEQASIDEAYMDVTGTAELYRSFETEEQKWPLSLAYHISNEIKTDLGFTVNVGVSVNKLLAKMASDFEKPDKVHTLYPEEIPRKMWPLPVGELFGCGARTAERLRTLGVVTIGDAAALDEEVLKRALGDKAGTYIWRSANGLSDSPVEPVREEAKSASNEITLSADIVDSNFNRFMPVKVHSLSESVARRLRKAGLYGSTVVATVKTSDFRRRSKQVPLSAPTDSAPIIEAAAMDLFRDLCFGTVNSAGLFAEDVGVRLVGVGVTNIDHGENRQLSLFDLPSGTDTLLEAGESAENETNSQHSTEKQHKLDAMEDAINGKFGDGVLKRGL